MIDAKTASSNFKSSVKNEKARIARRITAANTVYGKVTSFLMNSINNDISNCVHPTVVILPGDYIKDLTDNQRTVLMDVIKSDFTMLGFGILTGNRCIVGHQEIQITVSYL